MSEGGSSFRATGPRYAPAVPPTAESKLRDVSKAYEKLFMQQMVKSMRSSVHESGFIKQNAAEKLFREELDAEYLQSWSDRGGVGFADLIYTHLVDRFGPQLGIKANDVKPVGPIAMNDRANLHRAEKAQSLNSKELAIKIDVDQIQGRTHDIYSPWSGFLSGKKILENDQQLLEITHENGLKSRLTFRGQAERLNMGQALQAGEKIGLLSPDARSLFWTLGEEKVLDTNNVNSTVSE